VANPLLTFPPDIVKKYLQPAEVVSWKRMGAKETGHSCSASQIVCGQHCLALPMLTALC